MQCFVNKLYITIDRCSAAIVRRGPALRRMCNGWKEACGGDLSGQRNVIERVQREPGENWRITR